MAYSSTAMETIAAIATPPGRGGVGIVRVSGKDVPVIAREVLGKLPGNRVAEYVPFRDAAGNNLDIGIALYFQAPNSFTGEDVLELQGHGGPVVMDMLLQRVIELGARIARPGEFSERAFLNNKLDLAQAEAIADLIDSESEQAARCAMRSLQGEFSRRIHELVEQMTELRMFVESAIDFPEEEIDFLKDKELQQRLSQLLVSLNNTLASARQGSLLREGMTIVIAGQPNAGKSTLLNRLTGRDSAIVTDIPGTTRDVLREHIQIDGMPLHVVDTAGLRHGADSVEQEGIRRARDEINKADQILYVIDATCRNLDKDQQFIKELEQAGPGITVLFNKSDRLNHQYTSHPLVKNGVASDNYGDQLIEFRAINSQHTCMDISAKTGQGIDRLRDHLKQAIGYRQQTEGGFIARRRHLHALEQALEHVLIGQQQLNDNSAGELMAEELRQAQLQMSSITGEFSADDLLGRIFSSFCIGK